MNPAQSQHDYLRAAKEALGLDWDTLAVRAGIAPRALKSYRLPESSKGFRTMPALARDAIADLVRSAGQVPAFAQHDFLRSARAALGLTWADLAEQAGIRPLTLKNYLRPDTAQGHRKMPALARAAIERLLAEKGRQV